MILFHIKLGFTLSFLGLNVVFLGLAYGEKAVNCELFIFSKFLTSLNLNFSLICGCFELFIGPHELFWAWGKVLLNSCC